MKRVHISTALALPLYYFSTRYHHRLINLTCSELFNDHTQLLNVFSNYLTPECLLPEVRQLLVFFHLILIHLITLV